MCGSPQRSLLLGTLFALFLTKFASGQTGYVGGSANPVVISNGSTISLSSFGHSIVVANPIQVTGTGGTLSETGNTATWFLGPFTGSGTLTINLNTVSWMMIGSPFTAPPQQRISCNLNLLAGSLIFGNEPTVLAGSLQVSGTCSMVGNTIVTSNTVSGTAGANLILDTATNNNYAGILTFTGSGPDFNLAANIDPSPSVGIVHSVVIMANHSGTQTFGGTIGDAVYRAGIGGTTVYTGNLKAGLNCSSGTAILGGVNGSANVSIIGGTAILDNTQFNNLTRLQGLGFGGGTLSLLGINGGVTNYYLNQPRGTNQTTGPVFGSGCNSISITPGTGDGSAALFTFGGLPTSYDGNIDFKNLGPAAQVFFNSMPTGPIAPWATYNGVDFAGYDTTLGVVPMPTDGRPAQVSTATAGSYVLGTGTLSPLTANTAVYGVTMNSATALDLGGKTLKTGAWIQNTGAATISNGTLMDAVFFDHDHYFGDIVFTTNADVTLSAFLVAGSILKTGPATLNITGPAFGAYQMEGFPILEVDQGTLTLNANSPMYNFYSFTGFPSILIGKSGGAAGSAVLSLLGDNQFSTNTFLGSQVGVQVYPAGQMNFNGHNATMQYLEVDGGTVDLGSATLSTPQLIAKPSEDGGQIKSGTVALTGSSPKITVTYPSYSLSVDYPMAKDGLTVSAQITTTASLKKMGAGTLVLGNAANSFGSGSVGLIVSQGVAAFQIAGAAGPASQTIQMADKAGLAGEAADPITLNNPVTMAGANFSGTPLVLAGGVTQTADGEFNVAQNTITTVQNYSNSLSSSAVSGKAGLGTLILSGTGAGTSTGSFTMEGGTLALNTDTPLPPGMKLLIKTGRLQALTQARSIAAPVTITGDLLISDSQPITFSATSGNTLTGLHQITLNDASSLSLKSLTASSGFSLYGNGSLLLSGSPSLTGTVDVEGGTVKFQNLDLAPSLAGITIGSSGTFDLNGFNASTTDLEGSGALRLGSATLALAQGNFSGTIVGSGGLTKTGFNGLVLASNDTISGTVLISAGYLQVASTGALNGSGTITFLGGSLQYGSNAGVDFAARIANSTSPIQIDTNSYDVTYTHAFGSGNTGGLTKGGGGTLTIPGANNYSGITRVTGGKLVFSGGFNGLSTVIVNTGAKLTFNGGPFTASGDILNNGILTFGPGSSLSMSGTFTNNGTLDLSNAPGFVLPANFVNNGTVIPAPPGPPQQVATDTPLLPPWGGALIAALFFLASRRYLRRVST